MLNKTNYFNFPSGDIIRSTPSSVNNFYISGADSSIGSNRTGTGVNYNWKISQPGQINLRSPTNPFKHWAINESINNSSVLRYYNLGAQDSIYMNGDLGSIDSRKNQIAATPSSTLSNIFQANRNYTISGVVQSGHVAINNNGELIFNNGSSNTLILEHTGTITSPNLS